MTEPVRVDAHAYRGPMTIDGLSLWYDHIAVARMRELTASLQRAMDAGELDRDTDVEGIVEASMLVADEGRQDALEQIARILRHAGANG